MNNSIAVIGADQNLPDVLTQQERETLVTCEETITANIHTFIAVGQALRVIRDGRLYRETHQTFERYCRDRWDFTRTHGYRLIGATETMEVLSPIGGALPTAETQVRPLLQFELADRPKVWQDVQARLQLGASRCVTGRINQIVQYLIQGSDDKPYRRRCKELRKARRERLQHAEERMQRQFFEAHVTTRRQEAPLPDDNLTQLGNIASELQNTLVRMKDSYDAMEVPDDHVVKQMMVAIEVSIARLASRVAEQQAVGQTA